jgi:hypothetical protein
MSIRSELQRIALSVTNLVARIDLPSKVWVDGDLDTLDDTQLKSLWEMFEHSYRDIGLNVKSLSEMKNKYGLVQLVNTDVDAEPDAFIIYKRTPYGNKLALLGSDGSPDAKRAVIKRAVELAHQSGWYAEASHKIADLLIKNGLRPIDDELVVRTVLKGKEDFTWLGDGHYTRSLGGVGQVTKALFGHPRI